MNGERSVHSLRRVDPDDVQVAIINALLVFVSIARAPLDSVPRQRVARRSCDDVVVVLAVVGGLARSCRGCRWRRRRCPRAHARSLGLKRVVLARDKPVQWNAWKYSYMKGVSCLYEIRNKTKNKSYQRCESLKWSIFSFWLNDHLRHETGNERYNKNITILKAPLLHNPYVSRYLNLFNYQNIFIRIFYVIFVFIRKVHALHAPMCASSRFSGFLPPTKSIPVNRLPTLNCPQVWICARNHYVQYSQFVFSPRIGSGSITK